jgi:hypothetical protein
MAEENIEITGVDDSPDDDPYCDEPKIDVNIDSPILPVNSKVGAALIKNYASLKKYDKMFHVSFLKISSYRSTPKNPYVTSLALPRRISLNAIVIEITHCGA